MRVISRGPRPAAVAPSPRVYFVHVPKTAGITLKAYLENNFAQGESLVVDEWKARELSPEELKRYRLLSGHYSSEVLDALGERPDVSLMLVREPVARFRSWISHCRRVSHEKYRGMCEGHTDGEVLRGPGGHTCHQAHWLARAVRGGASYSGIPSAAELPALLDRVDIVGPTKEIERVMQLVAFRLGWPPPPVGWHINRQPQSDASRPSNRSDISDDDLRRHMAIDQELYDLGVARFWTAYAGMLSGLKPGAGPFTPETAAAVSVSTAQDWLRRFHEERTARLAKPAEVLDLGSDRPCAGEGWWWRECPQGIAYRWTGPRSRAAIHAAPLVVGPDYDVVIEFMGAADWPTWEAAGLEVNRRPVDVVRERFGPTDAGTVTMVLRARLTPEIVAAQEGLTRLVLSVPEAKPCLSDTIVEESFDTYHHDTRSVGLAVHRIRIEKSAARVQPCLGLRSHHAESAA